MDLKTNFHFHTKDDPLDTIEYTSREGIVRMAKCGFEVLAITCHNKMIWSPELACFAADNGILLISGIEINVGEYAGKRKHVIILNCDQEAEKIKTFADLAKYKDEHPNIFVLAPHPYLYGYSTLKNLLEKYIYLFDAIEHSWFYSKLSNRNKKAKKIADRYNLPFIATSDTHFFDFINRDYAVINAQAKTPEAVFAAVRQKRFKNITSPKRLISEMVVPFGRVLFQGQLVNISNKFKRTWSKNCREQGKKAPWEKTPRAHGNK
jgi:predicted metal-dependent phosphoesterase TrpH